MKVYQKTWFIVLMFVLFWTAPVGIYLIWKYKQNWAKGLKVGLSAVYGLFFVLLIIAFIAGGSQAVKEELSADQSKDSSISEVDDTTNEYGLTSRTTPTRPTEESTSTTTEETTTTTTTTATTTTTTTTTEPPTTTKRTTTTAEREVGQQYVLNTNPSRMKIHLPTCSDIKTIKPENRATSDKSIAELEREGYSCCGHCLKKK